MDVAGPWVWVGMFRLPDSAVLLPVAVSDRACVSISCTATCGRPEDLSEPFGEHGAVKDVYLPKDFHTG